MASRRPRSHHRAGPDPLAARLGARVRALRELRGFSFDAFAEELGRGYVSDLERGNVIPTLRILARLAEVLEIEIVDVVAIEDTPRQQILELTRDLSAAQLRALLREARAMAARARAKSPPAVPALPNPKAPPPPRGRTKR